MTGPVAGNKQKTEPDRSLIGRSLQYKLTFLILCCALVSTAVVGFVAYERVRSTAVEDAKEKLGGETRLMAQRFRYTYHEVARDLKMIAGMPPIQGIIRAQRNGGIDPIDGSTENQWRERLARIFRSFLVQRPDDFQIRYIGLADQGRELVRVDRNSLGPFVVRPENLQQKGKEPYFRLGASAQMGRVVFSEVTFNREHGSLDPREIPTMRGMMPVFDWRGERFGMLVINIDYPAILKHAFAEMKPQWRTIIVNGQGDYMVHPGGPDSSPRPLQMHQNYTETPPPIVTQALKTTQPELGVESDHMMSYIVNDDDGYGSFDARVSIIVQVPSEKLFAKANKIGSEVFAAGIGVVFAFVLGSVFFARSLMKPLSQTAIAIVENVADGLIVIDAGGRIERFNPSCERMFGYKAEEVVGQHMGMLVAEGAGEEFRGEFITHAGQSQSHGNTFEVEARTKSGAPLPLELSVNEFNLNGKVKYSAVMRDISERREVERVKAEFISTVSHELRTPLTSIRGSLGLIDNMLPSDLPNPAYQMISLAQKNTNRLISLVNDILDFEKLTSEEVTYEMTVVDLNAELIQAAELINGYADEFSIKIKTELPATTLQVEVDVRRFQQIIANLLSNAVKFSHKKGTVILRAQELDNRAEIEVVDFGEGIPEEFRGRIFNPFSQADSTSTRKKSGSGLGLSITKRLVEEMGGEIDFVSEPGMGTTFRVMLPLFKMLKAPSRIVLPEGDKRRLALHLEDDVDFTAMLGETLKDIAYVQPARDLAEAHEYLAFNDFDLLILDRYLPGEDGLSLLDALPPGADPIVAVVTAIDEPVDDPRVDLAIVKSRTDTPEIVERLTDLLEEARARKHAAASALGSRP